MDPIVLALDPGKRVTGVALLTSAETVAQYGVAKKQPEREAFVRAAVELAALERRPLRCVAETWDPPRHRRKRTFQGAERVEFDQKWTYETVLGMGAGWGLWLAELLRVGIREKDILRVTPNVWRDAVFGKRRGKDTDAAKLQALIFARHVFHMPLSEDLEEAKRRGDTDAAEAACIGAWALQHLKISNTKLKKTHESP